MPQPYPPGARRLGRPDSAVPCASCGELLGRGYLACATCTERVDAYWKADWAALLDTEGVVAGDPEERDLVARVFGAEPGAFPWTCTDWALRLTVCPTCRAELGTGDSGCLACAGADQARWAWDYAAMPTAMTYNEHSLRVTVAGLRAAHRRRDSQVSYWRLSLPFLLTGEPISKVQAQRVRTFLLAGREDELTSAASYAEMAALPDLPWRALA
ncbi:hypothetical protein SAMN05192558_10910 [Actinokineospora alba]|uniref:Uncharacterized protein n=1 Tax=Actinokineospora alba TaxID=504798 RepID=A0A1H0SNQ0_9PSEU|nr:hypothetical protein [Actinokineospora alba]TDP66621.1 hypothetical protein C8E96_2133 [Actinokineospora alba]SDJ39041.1 hypothetical protein SAMN05421871_114136 [Actinokineospora alba]SDP43285.1 hypothetical protein SAMN05192558_10910 [Actinokineospora alba]